MSLSDALAGNVVSGNDQMSHSEVVIDGDYVNSQTSPVLADLTELEQLVVTATRRGEWVATAAEMSVRDLAAARDAGLGVRAELIRELLLGRRGDLDPRGISVKGVWVVGQLDLDYVTAVTGLVLFECALPEGITCRHARLRNMHLNGSLVTGLRANGLRTDSDLCLEDAILTGADDDATIQLVGAHIGGQLSLDRATITNTIGPALDADHLRADKTVCLEGSTLASNNKGGTFRLIHAHVGDLNLTGAEITNTTGPALHADGLQSDRAVFLQGSTLTGAGEDGAVRLVGAHIGGQLNFDDVKITNENGSALVAGGLRADQDMFLNGATLTGTGDGGAVGLAGAHIGGHLDLGQAEITNNTGLALDGHDLRTDGPLNLVDATLTGSKGALWLLGARIGGHALLGVKQLSDSSDALLTLAGVEITGPLFLPAEVVCPARGTETGRHGCPDKARQIVVDELAFAGLLGMSWRQWLHLLVHHTPGYSPQPYRQLAAVERAAGHDNNARQILITQQDDLRRRNPGALGGLPGYVRHWLWGWLGRYGYRAHRLVTALALTLALAATLSYTAGQITTRPGHHAAERITPTATPASPGTPCSTIELIGFGIDRGLPLGATGLRAHCDLDTATHWGQTITVAIWILQALVWALATLAIAAYTGLVRKPT